MKQVKRIGISLLVLTGIILCSFFAYVNDYYKADALVAQSLMSSDTVKVNKISEGYFFDGSGTGDAIIFYPGGKVAFEAYAPLLYQLSQQGFDCFLIKMPCNLAIFGKDKADVILEQYKYDNWYIMGHSLGGAFGAVYAAEHADRLTGLCMLAAYPTSKIDDSLKTLTIYGSNDHVVNKEKMEKGKEYLPEDNMELCIIGGNHAMYGNYGEQKGDGLGEITTQEQQMQTVDAITSWIKND